MQEIWKDISGYEGIYQISNLGRVKSLSRTVLVDNNPRKLKEKIMNQTPVTNGYLSVNFCVGNNRKKFLVHRLVAQEFLPNPLNLPQLNHIDENILNNSVYNLEWCTCEYNNNYGMHNTNMSIAKSKPVRCVELNKIFPSMSKACKETGIHVSSISASCKNEKRRAGGFHWEVI